MMSAVLKRAGHSTRLILLSTESAAYREDVLEQTAELGSAAIRGARRRRFKWPRACGATG